MPYHTTTGVIQAYLPIECAGRRYVVCDSFENPRKVYVWDLEANTAFVVGTFAEANWPSPETGRRGLHTHFTPDGQLHYYFCSLFASQGTSAKCRN